MPIPWIINRIFNRENQLSEKVWWFFKFGSFLHEFQKWGISSTIVRLFCAIFSTLHKEIVDDTRLLSLLKVFETLFMDFQKAILPNSATTLILIENDLFIDGVVFLTNYFEQFLLIIWSRGLILKSLSWLFSGRSLLKLSLQWR